LFCATHAGDTWCSAYELARWFTVTTVAAGSDELKPHGRGKERHAGCEVASNVTSPKPNAEHWFSAVQMGVAPLHAGLQMGAGSTVTFTADALTPTLWKKVSWYCRVTVYVPPGMSRPPIFTVVGLTPLSGNEIVAPPPVGAKLINTELASGVSGSEYETRMPTIKYTTFDTGDVSVGGCVPVSTRTLVDVAVANALSAVSR
jgi:hypothetical protein